MQTANGNPHSYSILSISLYNLSFMYVEALRQPTKKIVFFDFSLPFSRQLRQRQWLPPSLSLSLPFYMYRKFMLTYNIQSPYF